jgi:putative nucleotidyltransferase with HDIG domain
MALKTEVKEEAFKQELELIFNNNVREFTRLCIVSAPDYFFIDCPASSTGKYHPLSELGPDGTMLHTKKVFTVAYELCRGLGCEKNRDEILAACLIHDLVKQGWKRSGHTMKSHPKLGADLVEQVQTDTQILDDTAYNLIRNCVGYHYGPWSISPWKKPLEGYTPEELCVYLSDYVASKRCVEVDYRRG